MSDSSHSDRGTSSTPSERRPSGRKGNKKVRTGCLTCKIRKVKCDEGKPACIRCVKTGRTCDGYVSPRPRAPRSTTSASPSAPLTLHSPSSIPDLSSIDEYRAFDYYRSRCALLLGKEDVEGFWGGLVLKMSFTEPAVRHALLAMSSLHEGVVTRGGHHGSSFAFKEYSMAIAAVREYESSEPAAIPLLVCVLFICIEFLLDYKCAAQLHICQGRQILSRLGEQAAESNSPAMEMVKRDLVPIYARLSLASVLFSADPAPIPLQLISGAGRLPAVFTTVTEAKNTLYHLVDEGLRFTRIARPMVYKPYLDPLERESLKTMQQGFLSRLGQWKAAFTIFTATTDAQSTAKCDHDLLLIYYESAVIWTSTALSTLELDFDVYMPQFANIISLASSIVASKKESGGFAFETELLPPVYWTATKCRHPLLRRAALAVLSRPELKGRRENLWHTEELMAVVSRVIEIEEEGLEFADQGSSIKEEVHLALIEMPTLPPPWSRGNCLDGIDDLVIDPLEPRESVERLTPTSSIESTIILEPLPTVEPEKLLPPFGVTEAKRLKSVLVGDMEPGGLWLTTFIDPEQGASEWDIRKFWIKV